MSLLFRIENTKTGIIVDVKEDTTLDDINEALVFPNKRNGLESSHSNRSITLLLVTVKRKLAI